jgi:HTH-type transcriptional regulator, glycine betaine synthesis regulator
MDAPRDNPLPPPISQRLTAAQERFVATWGQMGSTWGISRTMAEVHALLYITGEPMCTDDVMERLAISRGNASMSIRSLVDWGIVTRTHKRGDRKEYFQAEQDVWALLQAIVRERMKRELQPVLASLYEIRDLTAARDRSPADGAETLMAAHHGRIDGMIDLVRTLEQMGEKLVELPREQLQALAQHIAEPTG